MFIHKRASELHVGDRIHTRALATDRHVSTVTALRAYGQDRIAATILRANGAEQVRHYRTTDLFIVEVNV